MLIGLHPAVVPAWAGFWTLTTTAEARPDTPPTTARSTPKGPRVTRGARRDRYRAGLLRNVGSKHPRGSGGDFLARRVTVPACPRGARGPPQPLGRGPRTPRPRDQESNGPSLRDGAYRLVYGRIVHDPPLTQRSATALARAIREGEVSSREVVEAHIEMCKRYQPRTGAIAVERFDAARREADAADARIASGRRGRAAAAARGAVHDQGVVCAQGHAQLRGAASRGAITGPRRRRRPCSG